MLEITVSQQKINQNVILIVILLTQVSLLLRSFPQLQNVSLKFRCYTIEADKTLRRKTGHVLQRRAVSLTLQEKVSCMARRWTPHILDLDVP